MKCKAFSFNEMLKKITLIMNTIVWKWKKKWMKLKINEYLKQKELHEFIKKKKTCIGYRRKHVLPSAMIRVKRTLFDT